MTTTTEKKTLFDRYLDARERICPHCGTTDVPKRRARGSAAIDLFLWIAALVAAFSGYAILILVALLHSLWRLATRYDACRSCNQAGPIRLKSPRGRELLEKYGRRSGAI